MTTQTQTQATAAASGSRATERFRENKRSAAGTGTERVGLLASRVIKAINDAVLEEKVSYDEYNAFKAWLIKVGEDGEWPLFLDVWVEHSVEQVANEHRQGSKGTIEGPYYVPGAPALRSPATLPMREGEPGTPLLFQGRVTNVDGQPLAGAQVEIWHADDAGFYSQYAPGLPEMEPARDRDRRRRGRVPDQHRAAGAVPDPHGRSLRAADRRRRLARLAPGAPAPEGLRSGARADHHPAVLHRRSATSATTSPRRSSPS